MEETVFTLDKAKTGERLIVTGFAFSSKLTKRLEDLGLKKGTSVTIFALSPFSSPAAIKFGDFKLILGDKALKTILVRKAK